MSEVCSTWSKLTLTFTFTSTMLAALDKWFAQHTSWLSVAAAFVFMNVLQYIAVSLMPPYFEQHYGAPQFDLIFLPSADQIVSHAAVFGAPGCRGYTLLWLPLDTVLPIAATLFFGLAMAGARAGSSSWLAHRVPVAFVAVVPTVFDFVENTLFAVLCLHPPTMVGDTLQDDHWARSVAQFLPLVSKCKFAALGIALVATSLLAAMGIVRRLCGKGHTE